MIRVTKNLRLFAEIQGYQKPVLLRYESDGWNDGRGFSVTVYRTPVKWLYGRYHLGLYVAILGILIYYRRR